MEELWKPVVGYEGLYEVSSKGRVKRLAGWRKHGRGVAYFEDRLRTPVLNGRGYPHVTLSKDGKHKTVCLHRLVMLAHVGPRPGDMEVCHNDGDRTNAKLSNLRYDTKSGNQQDRPAHGTDLRGTKHPGAKLDEAKVRYIRSLTNPVLTDLARQFGTTPEAIAHVVKGRSWKYAA